MINTNNQNNDNNNNLVARTNDKPVQSILKIAKDENGFIELTKLKLNDVGDVIPVVEKTQASLKRALRENFTSSLIPEIDAGITETYNQALEESKQDIQQHFNNRLVEINNAMAGFKQRSIERQKQYLNTEKVEKPSIWATPIDIYNIGEVQEGSLGGNENSSTVDSNKVNKGQSFDI